MADRRVTITAMAISRVISMFDGIQNDIWIHPSFLCQFEKGNLRIASVGSYIFNSLSDPRIRSCGCFLRNRIVGSHADLRLTL